MQSGPNTLSKLIVVGCALLLVAMLASASTATKKTTSKKTVPSTASSKSKTSSGKTTKAHKSRKTTARKRGQQNIDPTRAREIQAALIRDGYMQGEASGTWDQASQKAMEKFQSDNG